MKEMSKMLKSFKFRGKKTCKKCGKKVGCRLLTCECGHVFEKVIKEVKQIQTFDEAGKGRKQCPCGKYVAARSKCCPVCNHNFEKGETTEVKNEEKEKIRDAWDNENHEFNRTYAASLGAANVKVVIIPSGKCPAILSEVNGETVFKFCDDIVALGLEEGKLYTPKAIRYWAGTILGFNSTDLEAFDVIMYKWLDTIMVSKVEV